MMVAIPELDGATGPMVFGGRAGAQARRCTGCHHACTFGARTARTTCTPAPSAPTLLAARVAQAGRPAPQRARGAQGGASVLFNFPPNAGNTGTAAFLSVFESLYNTLEAMQARGLHGRRAGQRRRAARTRSCTATPRSFGADANVHTRIPADDHVRRERWLKEIEAQWGPAPGRQQSDGRSIFVLGSAVRQRASSASSRPSATKATRCGCCSRRALRRRTRSRPSTAGCARTSAPTRCCTSARTARSNSCPASRAGLSGACWPDRLIGDLPNLYLYASNNPSEGTIAKRRSARHADQLPDAAGGAGRAVRGPGRPEGARSSAGARWSPSAADERARARRC